MTQGSEALARLQGLTEDYRATVAALEAKRRPGDGLLGLKGGPEDDPCHERFAAEVEGLLKESTAASSSGEAAAILAYLLETPDKLRDSKSAYWMLIAVQGFGMDLIDRLNAADAKALLERFTARYPRWERLPVQDQLLKKLKNRSL